MRYKTVIFDSNNAWWRSWYSNATDILQGKNVLYTGGIEQFFKNIKKIRDEFGYIDGTKLYFLFDNTVSTLELRKIISGGTYKSHRLTKKSQEILYKDLEYLIEIIKCYDNNFLVVRKEKCEADDLVKPILDRLKIDKNNKCLLVSVDMDWSRSITEDIHWYNYKDVMGRDKFNKKYGFDPLGKSVQLYKAIRGDSADSIKSSVPNIPEKIVLDIVNNYEDVNELMRELWETDYPTNWKHKIKEHEMDIRKNYKLVDFIDIQDNIGDYIYTGKENVRKLEKLYTIKNIPLENRMINKEKKRNAFLGRR